MSLAALPFSRRPAFQVGLLTVPIPQGKVGTLDGAHNHLSDLSKDPRDWTRALPSLPHSIAWRPAQTVASSWSVCTLARQSPCRRSASTGETKLSGVLARRVEGRRVVQVVPLAG